MGVTSWPPTLGEPNSSDITEAPHLLSPSSKCMVCLLSFSALLLFQMKMNRCIHWQCMNGRRDTVSHNVEKGRKLISILPLLTHLVLQKHHMGQERSWKLKRFTSAFSSSSTGGKRELLPENHFFIIVYVEPNCSPRILQNRQGLVSTGLGLLNSVIFY